MNGNRSSTRKKVHSTMNLVPYTPAWVAACYGVKVTDECPVVDLHADIEDAQAMAAWEDATLLRNQREWLAEIHALYDNDSCEVAAFIDAANGRLTYDVASANRHSLREGPA